MKFVWRVWSRLCVAVRWKRAPKEPRWIEPGNAITHAINAGLVGDLPRLRTEYRHRPVTLDDYPALAAALEDLEAQRSRRAPLIERADPVPTPAVAPPATPTATRGERRPPVSTRSARRRRHHHAA